MLKYQQEYKYYYCWFEIQSNYSGTANPPSYLGAFPFKFPRSSIAISISNSRLMRLVSLSDSCQIVLILNEIVNTGRFEYPGSTCTLGLSLQNPYHYKIPQLGPPPCVPPAGATTTSRWGQYCVWDHHQYFFFWPFYPLFCTPTRFLIQVIVSEPPGCTTKLMSKPLPHLFHTSYLGHNVDCSYLYYSSLDNNAFGQTV